MTPSRPHALSTLLTAASLGLAAALFSGCQLLEHWHTEDAGEQRSALRAELAPHLGVLGARNWIVIADPACPILAGEGVDVLTVEAGTADTLREVLSTLTADGTLTPRIWTSTELDAVPERRAPGARRLRRELDTLTRKHLRYEMTERIISLQLAQAAQTYRILYIKTSTAIPYSSVAIELDSGYWNSDDEAELRERVERLNTPAPSSPLPTPENATWELPEA